MRNRTTLIIILFGVIFGIASTAYVKDKAKAQRQPASVKGKQFWMPAPAGKHLSLIKVDIQTEEQIPEYGTDQVTLKGRILVNQEVNGDLLFSWSLPEDVELVEGETTGSVSNLKMGQIIDVNLTVSGFNKEKQRLISLQASGHKGQELLGNAATIVSRPEDTWESVAPEMKKAADEQLGTESKSRRSRF